MSPTQLTLNKWRKAGWMAAVVEKYNPHVQVRQDLFGFIDVLVCKENVVIGIQTTTSAHMNDRIAKVKSHPNFPIWWNPPTREVLVEGWAKQGPRGKRKVWTCREVWI